MQVLIDDDLRLLVEDPDDPLIDPKPDTQDWYTRDSPIQPSSIDFHVGEIFVPGRPPDLASNPVPIRDRFVLESGQTVVIRTLEKICLRSELAGFGFPPSRISVQGILMTNPGHLDPGYKGHLHLTAINMGRDPFELRKGDPIVTIVLVKLAARPKADFAARYPGASPSHISQAQIDRLSADFVNVQERAQKIADQAVKDAELTIKKAQQNATIIGTILTALIAAGVAIFTLYWNNQSKVEILNRDYVKLEKEVDDKIATSKQVEDLRQQIERLKNQISEMQQKNKRK